MENVRRMFGVLLLNMGAHWRGGTNADTVVGVTVIRVIGGSGHQSARFGARRSGPGHSGNGYDVADIHLGDSRSDLCHARFDGNSDTDIVVACMFAVGKPGTNNLG
jgi:hypothetical protein